MAGFRINSKSGANRIGLDKGCEEKRTINTGSERRVVCLALGQAAQLVGASSCAPEVASMIPGRAPTRLQVQSSLTLIGEATSPYFSLTLMFLSGPSHHHPHFLFH